jgi:hypothetical protein
MVTAVAAGTLPDGTPVIISGGDGTVRVSRTADGTPVVPLLDLPESVQAVALRRNVIITAAGADIAVHQRSHDPYASVLNRQFVGRDARAVA